VRRGAYGCVFDPPLTTVPPTDTAGRVGKLMDKAAALSEFAESAPFREADRDGAYGLYPIDLPRPVLLRDAVATAGGLPQVMRCAANDADDEGHEEGGGGEDGEVLPTRPRAAEAALAMLREVQQRGARGGGASANTYQLVLPRGVTDMHVVLHETVALLADSGAPTSLPARVRLVREHLRASAPLFSGIAAYSAARLYHQDIKPPNVVLQSPLGADASVAQHLAAGVYKFIDFGLAQHEPIDFHASTSTLSSLYPYYAPWSRVVFNLPPDLHGVPLQVLASAPAAAGHGGSSAALRNAYDAVLGELRGDGGGVDAWRYFPEYDPYDLMAAVTNGGLGTVESAWLMTPPQLGLALVRAADAYSLGMILQELLDAVLCTNLAGTGGAVGMSVRDPLRPVHKRVGALPVTQALARAIIRLASMGVAAADLPALHAELLAAADASVAEVQPQPQPQSQAAPRRPASPPRTRRRARPSSPPPPKYAPILSRRLRQRRRVAAPGE